MPTTTAMEVLQVLYKKKKLIRACEFSTNGTILSCSKWFDEKNLKQGKNEGLNMEDI